MKQGAMVVLQDWSVERTWHSRYTTGGFPDPSWPAKPALQLCIAGVCQVALLLVRMWLQGRCACIKHK